MTTKADLMGQAEEAARFRGHVLSGWITALHKGWATCTRCGMSVMVNTKPAPNEIDIGGDAVALTCPSTTTGCCAHREGGQTSTQLELGTVRYSVWDVLDWSTYHNTLREVLAHDAWVDHLSKHPEHAKYGHSWQASVSLRTAPDMPPEFEVYLWAEES